MFGMIFCHSQRNPTAKRMTNQVYAILLYNIKKLRHQLGILPHRGEACGNLSIRPARQLRGIDKIGDAKSHMIGLPASPSGQAVEIEQPLTATALEIRNSEVANLRRVARKLR